MTYQIDDTAFDAEIKSIRSGLREFKDNRKQFNAKIENIRKGADKLTEYNNNVPAPSQYNQSPLAKDLSYYKKTPTDTIQNAVSNCIADLGETTQLSQADRTKACQQLAAKVAKIGADHISQYSRSASVRDEEVPAWAVTYDYVNNKGIGDTSNKLEASSVRSGSVEYEEPYHVTVMNHSPLERSQNIANDTRKIKQASVSNTDQDIPAWLVTYNHVINKY